MLSSTILVANRFLFVVKRLLKNWKLLSVIILGLKNKNHNKIQQKKKKNSFLISERKFDLNLWVRAWEILGVHAEW